MRQFVCIGHEVPTDADFSLDDLAGGAGRLDALCRSITASFVTSHGIREDVRTHLVVQDELTITFDGSELRRLNPDERSTAALVRNALEHREEAIGALPAEPSPGIEVYRRGFEATLEELADDGTVVQLHEDGESVGDVEALEDPIFVLSDHQNFTDKEVGLLEDVVDRRLRLGPSLLHADQAITVAHHYLDTDGYETF
ncbi:tRNA (pseudouridine(54)-N(1))-methyltransferase TrmY [Natronorubrum daqingense]|uniref:tRNA (pseudouridine(54)-N(1))-methyltransferase n=1 Tax=Natronorubrum daqingense TaxID=588898 RepID=A0A1N6ZU30_9EURY|nr:tRNA (pseudouridine(54)-N(1))-methyltransferase TrmY [Natronorubrum daqingense]APX95247.1 tRNA (pseudouridine(54)-N(1))-methyltransferase TrmY [Natronorubrum daqingense]SIR30350.1 tRNA (pseudouridine54-N1)-methyltransferase [Natronorubrum daqingense]